ncbi:MAG: HD-GYP domain-containing protein [Anaerolineae bacterium]
MDRQAWRRNDWLVLQSLLLVSQGLFFLLSYHRFGFIGVIFVAAFLLSAFYLFKAYASRAQLRTEFLESANIALDRANQGLIEILGAVIDARDVYTYGHSAQVAAYALAIAREMGLSEEEQEVIYKAGLLHDIGKLGVSENILNKPRAVTQDEYDILRQHPVIGASILSQMEEMKGLAEIVAHHHENYNGQGYPYGKKGEDIPLASRILCVADSLEAMLSDRPYRAGRNLEKALEEIKRNAGEQFDPQVVEALLKVAALANQDFFKNSAEIVKKVAPGELFSNAGPIKLIRPVHTSPARKARTDNGERFPGKSA